MTIQTVLTCPLGSKCEEARDNVIHRCAWYAQMRGMDPTTGQEKDERACAMAWMPLLLVENSQQQIRTTKAVESFRNETAAASQSTAQLLAVAASLSRPPISKPDVILPEAPGTLTLGG